MPSDPSWSSGDVVSEAQQALTMSEEELLEQIGRRTFAGAVLPPVDVVVERGGEWIDAQQARIRDALCRNSVVLDLEQSGESKELLVAVLSALAATLHLAGGLAFLGAVVVKRGVRSFCADVGAEAPE